jgi:hypothetical protein
MDNLRRATRFSNRNSQGGEIADAGGHITAN